MVTPGDMSSFQLQQRIRELGLMVKSLPVSSSGPLVSELHDLCFEYALRLQRIGKEVELPS